MSYNVVVVSHWLTNKLCEIESLLWTWCHFKVKAHVNIHHVFVCRRQCGGGAGARRGGRQSGGQTGGVRQRGRREEVGDGDPPGGGQALRLLHQVRWRLPHLRLRPGQDVLRPGDLVPQRLNESRSTPTVNPPPPRPVKKNHSSGLKSPETHRDLWRRHYFCSLLSSLMKRLKNRKETKRSVQTPRRLRAVGGCRLVVVHHLCRFDRRPVSLRLMVWCDSWEDSILRPSGRHVNTTASVSWWAGLQLWVWRGQWRNEASGSPWTHRAPSAFTRADVRSTCPIAEHYWPRPPCWSPVDLQRLWRNRRTQTLWSSVSVCLIPHVSRWLSAAGRSFSWRIHQDTFKLNFFLNLFVSVSASVSFFNKKLRLVCFFYFHLMFLYLCQNISRKY